MNKIISSWITKVICILAGYCATLLLISAANRSFRYYMSNVFGALFGEWPRNAPIVPLALSLSFAALLFFSVWKSGGGRKIGKFGELDYSLLAVCTISIILVCANYIRFYTYQFAQIFSPYFAAVRDYPIGPLLLSAAAYMAFAILLMETAARLRDRSFAETLCWVSFFKLYPARKAKGFFAAAALAANLLYLLVFCPFEAVFNARLNVLGLLISAFAIIIMSYFCSIVLSLSAEYDEANAEKIRTERFKAELITNVSHDIRTPLTSIINYVDLLKALPFERDDFKEYVSVLDRKSARLKTLISDLMDASKAATGNVAVNLQAVDLSEITGQIAGEFDDQFNDRGLTYVFRQLEGQIVVNADSNHLWRVLENLFGNAAKYSLPGTRVFAEINVHGGKAALSLKNTSKDPIDMPADDLTEQFIRGDRARHTDGSGLGLHIAKSLVELMGGSFEIRASGDLFEVEIVFENVEAGAV